MGGEAWDRLLLHDESLLSDPAALDLRHRGEARRDELAARDARGNLPYLWSTEPATGLGGGIGPDSRGRARSPFTSKE